MILSETYKKRLKELSGLIKENEEQSNTLIIPKGTELFHGTLEKFDLKNVRPGGYDEIFWTTTEVSIAQSYIPVAGSETLARTKYLSKPSTQKSTTDMQEQMGIHFSDVETKGVDVKSYIDAPIFKEVNKRKQESYNRWRELKDKFAIAEKEFIDSDVEDYKIRREEASKLAALKNELSSIEKEAFGHNYDKERNEIVNNILEKKFGYQPEEDYKDEYNSDYSWRLKSGYNDNGKYILMPADYRAQGRLLIATPKEDLKIFDYTYGESRESDLTDTDYHKLDLFRKIEKAGYDGIKITDYAQVEGSGNVGHYSIGIFINSIPKLHFVEIPAKHPMDYFEKFSRGNEKYTPEYKEYLKNKSLQPPINQ